MLYVLLYPEVGHVTLQKATVEPVVRFTYPLDGTASDRVVVTSADEARLEPNTFVNDNIINMMFR
eukprot:55425-Eustigmatos_ZCMA.PRE.1